MVGPGSLRKLRELYCPDDPKNPYVSPCYAEYQGFPPFRVVWDAGEQLSYDSRVIAEKAKKAGVTVEAKEYRGNFHTFEMLGKLIPEARKEIRESIKFMEKHI